MIDVYVMMIMKYDEDKIDDVVVILMKMIKKIIL